MRLIWLTRQTKAKQKNLGSGKRTDSKKESYFTPGFKQEVAEDLQQPSFNNGYPKLYLKDSRAWRTDLSWCALAIMGAVGLFLALQ